MFFYILFLLFILCLSVKHRSPKKEISFPAYTWPTLVKLGRGQQNRPKTRRSGTPAFTWAVEVDTSGGTIVFCPNEDVRENAMLRAQELDPNSICFTFL